MYYGVVGMSEYMSAGDSTIDSYSCFPDYISIIEPGAGPCRPQEPSIWCRGAVEQRLLFPSD